jgi:ribosomal protein S18 acetylase RimI-like enzyme
MTLRDLRWSDFDDLRESYYLLYEERARGDPVGITLFEERPSLEEEAAWFSNLFRRVQTGEFIEVVAEEEGHAVGHCTVGPPAPGVRLENRHVGVLGIIVHRDHRGRGHGTALLTEAIRRARGQFPVLRLEVFADNLGAQRLYQRFGFQRCGSFPYAILRNGRYIGEETMYLNLAAGPGPSNPQPP